MTKREKLELPATIKGVLGGFVGLEVGWSKKPKNANKARVRIGHSVAVIDLKDLLIFAFRHGTLEQKTDAIPHTSTELRTFKRQHTVKVTKDLKAGETLVVTCQLNIPEAIVEASTRPPLSSEDNTSIM